MTHRYLIALGGNLRHPRHGAPPGVLRAALAALATGPELALEAASPILASAPLGPSRRRYANAVAIVASRLDPPGLLARLQALEAEFGRRRRGRRWVARTLDLDIVLWSGGAWASPGLTVPHRAFRHRGFVVGPALAIAATWRDPLTGLTLRQLAARLTRPSPARNAAPERALSSVGRATDF
ncbi:MAG: 2-amino-4-hydroxy-6-hydroxymethyldihydropteridine diphosphokinase [Novosphingobium sp.]|nr:2-amino-4-hydroxy-6-hydroxymethyldihydropteridine diphosphokinase [Novosphingobium sp.]